MFLDEALRFNDRVIARGEFGVPTLSFGEDFGVCGRICTARRLSPGGKFACSVPSAIPLASTMTRLLDQVLEAARNLPPAAQDDIARVVLRLAGNDDEEPPMALSPEEHAAIAASQAAATHGEFATDEQVRAAWAKHGL